jgi:antitoxin ParD1/3/4
MADTRASLFISTPNESWLQAQIDSGEFASRSEVVNDLIRKARENDREAEYIRSKLLASEKSVEKHGWVKEKPNEILDGFKQRARHEETLK